MSEVLKTLTHKDVPIEVTLSRGNVSFVPKIDTDSYHPACTSLEAAHKRIDDHISAKARIKARALDISHRAVDADGNEMTIKGINRQDGYARVTDYRPNEREQKAFNGTVYADRPWVRELLVEYKDLRAKVREIEKRLDPVSTSVGGRSYGRKVEISDYERLMTRMTAELETATKRAVELEGETND